MIPAAAPGPSPAAPRWCAHVCPPRAGPPGRGVPPTQPRPAGLRGGRRQPWVGVGRGARERGDGGPRRARPWGDGDWRPGPSAPASRCLVRRGASRCRPRAPAPAPSSTGPTPGGAVLFRRSFSGCCWPSRCPAGTMGRAPPGPARATPPPRPPPRP